VKPASRLGFGVSGPHATALVPERQTIGLIEAALSEGITTFDTGPSYGAGEAERRLGRALAGVSVPVCVMTKAGVLDAGFGRRLRDFSPDAVLRSLEASLKRLGRDRIDLVWLHGPASEELTDALFSALDRFGAAARLGLVGRGPELEVGLARRPFQAVMAPVGAHLSADDRARLGRITASGVALYGIEGLAAAAPDRRRLRSPADLWYLARGLARPRPALLKPETALAAALATPSLHRLVITTTRFERLAANAALARRLDPSPVGP
jgi:hypothetical protein